MNRRSAVGVVAAAAAGLAGPCVRAQAAFPIRLALNPKFVAYLPVFVGVDRGYFQSAGVDLRIIPYFNSSADQIALLIRGDIDMMPILAGPALYNGYQRGIDLKLIASTSEATLLRGYDDVQWVMVRKDLWDAGTVRTLADLRGKNFDGGTRGSALHVLALETLAMAHLTLADVHFTNRSTGPADQTAALVNKAVDVQATTEPTASLMQQRGLAVKWLAARDVMPWFQDSYMGVATAYLQSGREALLRFLRAYLRGIDDIQRSRGRLTPALLATIAKWSQLPPNVIRAAGSVPYFGQDGAINVTALARLQQIWIEQNLVEKPIDVARVYDASLLEQLRAH